MVIVRRHTVVRVKGVNSKAQQHAAQPELLHCVHHTVKHRNDGLISTKFLHCWFIALRSAALTDSLTYLFSVKCFV